MFIPFAALGLSLVANFVLLRSVKVIIQRSRLSKRLIDLLIRMNGQNLENLRSLSRKDKLLRGTNKEVVGTLVARFVDVHTDIEDEFKFLEESSQESKSVGAIQLLLEQALTDCGAKKFFPRVGESYRTAFGVAPHPKVIATDLADRDWTIASVVSPGYCINSPRDNCIREAVVVVYRYNPEVTHT